MIYFVRPMPAGTAVQVFLQPPTGARKWRLLRKGSDTFSGYDDPAAALITESSDEKTILDMQGLANGQLYYYRAYYWNGTAWSATATVSATPGLAFADVGPDPLLIVRQRIDDGLRGLVKRGDLKHPKGHIQVLASLPSIDDVVLPVVTVALKGDGPIERGIGDGISSGLYDEDLNEWQDVEGWFARVSLEVNAWTFNVEERISLRRAIRALVIANLSVFDSAGLQLIEFSQSDADDPATYGAPMFISNGVFSCTVPAAVTYDEAAIREVISTLHAEPTYIGPVAYPPQTPADASLVFGSNAGSVDSIVGRALNEGTYPPALPA